MAFILSIIFKKRTTREEVEGALFWKDLDLLQKLLRRGADPNGLGYCQTYLGRAIECRFPQAVELLLDAGADPRQPFRFMGLEFSMVEGAEKYGLPPAIVERLRDAERNAIETLGPGPELRREPVAGGICFPTAKTRCP